MDILGSAEQQAARTRADSLIASTDDAISAMPAEDVRGVIKNLQAYVDYLELQIGGFKKTQDDLLRAQDRIAQLFDLAPVGFLTLNQQASVVDVNQTFADMLGLNRDRLIGKPFNYLVFEEDRYILRSHMYMLETHHKSHVCELRLSGHDGKIFWVSMSSNFVVNSQDSGTLTRHALADVSERKREKDKLESTEKQHLEAQRLAKMGHWELELASSALSWSDEVYRIFGLQRSQENPTFQQIFELIHPEDIDAVNQSIEESLDGRGPFNTMYRIVLPNREEKYLHVLGYGEWDNRDCLVKLMGTIQDVTARQYETRQRQLLELAVKSSEHGVVITDRNGEIVFANPAATRMTGYSATEIIGQNPRILKSDRQDPTFYRDMWETISHGNSWSGELINRRKDGSEYLEDQLVSPVLDDSGSPTHFVAIKRDITERRKLEVQVLEQNEQLEATVRERTAELEQLVEELNEANAQLENADIQKSRFLASMSHELRTPLNAVVGFSDLLLTGPLGALDERQSRQVRRISEAGSHLLEMINDLLDMAKIDAGALVISPEAVSIGELVTDAVELTSASCIAKNLRVQVAVDEKIPHVTCDPRRIKQVLLNLLSNAIKYSLTDGAIKITAELAPDKHVRVSVRDNGLGIPHEHQEGIFSEFVQSDRRRDEAIGGVGLGLALVHRLVEAHNGEVGVVSEVGEGATFWFTLPLETSESAALESEKGIEAAPQSFPDGLRILIAEDVEANVELLLDIFSAHGCEIEIVENGAQAVEAAVRFKPEIVLMDLRMPIMGGIEATRKLRATPGFETVPIVALSASADAENRAECASAGFTAFVAKPVVADEILREISRHIGSYRGENRLKKSK